VSWIRGRGTVVAITVQWQGNVPFYSKSVTQKLRGIADAFGFTIEPGMLDDHEELAALRWRLQSRLGKDNPVATKALTKLFFAYLRGGHEFLNDDQSIEKLFDRLVDQYGHHDIPADVSAPETGHLEVLKAEIVNPLISKYHFLGYGRDDGIHLGMQSVKGSDDLMAVATFSPWDIVHADHVLNRISIDRSEILILSRLLSVPGRRRVKLSRFIALLIGWVHREMKGIKAIATYCNPNAGHYGTVYRGANFIPLCYEQHGVAPFINDEYVSPRTLQALYDQGDNALLDELEFGAVTPVPLLLYWYPVRGQRKGLRALGSCRYPYPDDLVIARARVEARTVPAPLMVAAG
jgi:hypothetical protein